MKTFVPESLKEEIVSRPDWPEIEKKMKTAYGEDWELVAIKDWRKNDEKRSQAD